MPTRYTELLRKAKEHGFNALVVDVQGVFPSDEFIRHARESGFYLIARVVVFEGGLKTLPIPARHIEGVINEAERSARSGFMEVQLDYIRFADNLGTPRATLAERYRTIEGILKSAAEKIHPLGVRLGADIFGRIAFNHDDRIGQNVELFSKHIDTIYPMLYPSHFYGESNRQRDPYGTVLEGTRNCVNRTAGRSKIVSYIQGFRYGAGVSGLPITDYIRHQLRAAVDSGGGGFVVWEANNDYSDLFRAMPQAH